MAPETQDPRAVDKICLVVPSNISLVQTSSDHSEMKVKPSAKDSEKVENPFTFSSQTPKQGRKRVTAKVKGYRKIKDVGTKTSRLQCVTCLKKFNKMRPLKDHVLTHQNLRPHPCASCSLKFIYQGNRDRHQANDHFQEGDCSLKAATLIDTSSKTM